MEFRVKQHEDICKIPRDTRVLVWNVDIELRNGCIPDSVTHLIFGDSFNQPLEKGCIPDGVTDLMFGQSFNQELDIGHIPDSVVRVTFGTCFNQAPEKCHMPSSLDTIIYRDRNVIINMVNISPNIRVHLIPRGKSKNIYLANVKNRIYVKSCHLDTRIMNGEIQGVHYVDTIEENGITYLLVHGDAYVPNNRAKSARK